MLVVKPVDNQIVDRAAVFITQAAVAHLSMFQIGNLVGQQMIEKSGRFRAFDEKFAHVRYVEQSRLFTNGLMFFQNAGWILDGQPGVGKFNELALVALMKVV